jgi:branched-chain amino acid transport system substrate-binding protein
MRARSLAVAVLAASLIASGCGEDSPTAATGTAGGGCDRDKPFKIGAALPLTGPTAEGGKQTSAGIDVGVADINAAGGILGRCAQVVFKDIQVDATRASQETRELIDREGVEYVVGVIDSSMIFPVSTVTEEAGKILMVGATDTIDYAKNPHTFRSEVTVAQIGRKYVDYMSSDLGLERFGVLAINNPYGKGVAKAVSSAAGELGLEITKTEMFDPNALSLRGQVQAIRDSGAQALVTVVYGQAAIVALKARQQIGWKDPIFGSNGFATRNIIDGVGEAALENLLVSPTYKSLNREQDADVSDPKVVAFRDKLKKELGAGTLNDLMQQYVAGYDMVSIVAAAYNKVGSDDPEAVKSYLEQNPYDGLRATYTYSAGDHDGVPDEDIGMAVASSLKDGTLQAAKAGKE